MRFSQGRIKGGDYFRKSWLKKLVEKTFELLKLLLKNFMSLASPKMTLGSALGVFEIVVIKKVYSIYELILTCLHKYLC